MTNSAKETIKYTCRKCRVVVSITQRRIHERTKYHQGLKGGRCRGNDNYIWYFKP